MQCPVCKDPQLVMTERQGIEIDYCPQCRGVWLDRGELDKLIEKSMAASASAVAATAPLQPGQTTQQAYDPRQDPRHDPRSDRRYENQPHYRKKQKSWLSEFFD